MFSHDSCFKRTYFFIVIIVIIAKAQTLFRTIKSRRMRRVELVAFTGDRNAYRDLVGNPDMKKALKTQA